MTSTIWQRKNWIVGAVLLGATSLYVWLFYLPNYRHVEALRAQLEDKNAFILQTSGKLPIQIAKAQKEVDEVRRYTQTWSERLPRLADLPQLYAKLDRVANDAGVSTTQFKPLPEVELTTLTQCPVTVEMTGTFSELFNTIRQIESLPYVLWIEDLKLDKMRQDSETITCEARLVIFTSNSGDSN